MIAAAADAAAMVRVVIICSKVQVKIIRIVGAYSGIYFGGKNIYILNSKDKITLKFEKIFEPRKKQLHGQGNTLCVKLIILKMNEINSLYLR